MLYRLNPKQLFRASVFEGIFLQSSYLSEAKNMKSLAQNTKKKLRTSFERTYSFFTGLNKDALGGGKIF